MCDLKFFVECTGEGGIGRQEEKIAELLDLFLVKGGTFNCEKFPQLGSVHVCDMMDG